MINPNFSANNYIITDVISRINSSNTPTKIIGGKAANLIVLKQLQLPVSDFFIVTTDAFLAWMPKGIISELNALQNSETPIPKNRNNSLSTLLKQSTLPADLEQTILDKFDQTFAPNCFVSVRSSAIDEDSATDSFAGQLSTYLYVSREQLLNRVLDCFRSNFSFSLLAYRRERNFPLNNILGAVVIQEMVSSVKSGVLFTAHPVSGDTNVIVITAAYGLGEGVVADKVESDMFCIEKHSQLISEQTIAIKTKQINFNRLQGHDTIVNTIKGSQSNAPVLSPGEINSLVELAIEIETHYGAPQDIEWAIDAHGDISILQTRPITTFPCGQKRIFDNSNIVEGYPGITTPLTFSVVRFAYEIVFRNTAFALGASQRDVRSNQSRFANMVGFIEGRIYYQISNWYFLYQVIPGMAKNIPNWEKSLGLQATDPSKYLTQGMQGFFGSLKLNLTLLYHAITLNRRIANFHRIFKQTQHWFSNLALNTMQADALLDAFDQLVDRVIYRWECTTLNDLFVFKYFEMLENFINTTGLGSRNNLRNDLLANQPGMESVAPIESILRLSDYIRSNPTLLKLFQSKKHKLAIWRTLQTDNQHSIFSLLMQTHLDAYGDRSVEELKLEVPNMNERPELLIGLLQSYLITERSAADLNNHMSNVREQAELYTRNNLKNPLAYPIFLLLLKQCRKAVTERENMRFARTRAFGMIKRIYKQVGVQFFKQNLIECPEDIFFLSKEEIEGYVRGSATTQGLKELIAIRKNEQDHFQTKQPEGRLTTFGSVYNNQFPCVQTAAHDKDIHTLQGVGCSSGTVTAKAKVITNPFEAKDFENCILVAEITDPGWVFLMVAAKGIVIEKGNILSHTAIIGRELGIPTVIAVEGATTLIQDGQEITLDGEKGTVHLL
ncbi:MAG: hypothetical protein COB51_05590 [Moraxellaceae bacterium]|nr:MAG: hypothetical protein COB51_05590 [Moraxellaceae bacterium]